MPTKIKIFLTLLTLAAVFSIYKTGTSLRDFSRGTIGLTVSSPLPVLDHDADHDGLTNAEESYWNTDWQNHDTDNDGFKDGEEVASGHDPNKPGPGDLLNTSKNITDNLENLIVGGLYTKDLEPDKNNTKYNKSIDGLALAVIDDFYNSQTPSSRPRLTLIDSSRENQEIYLKDVAQIIKNDLLLSGPKIPFRGKAEENIILLASLKNNFDTIYQKLIQMSVPKKWKDLHHNLIALVDRAAKNYESLGQYKTDPYKAYVALGDLQNSDAEVKKILQQIQTNIIQNKLSLDDEFYKLLNLFYN